MDAIEDLINQEKLNRYTKDDNHRGRDKRRREPPKRYLRHDESPIRKQYQRRELSKETANPILKKEIELESREEENDKRGHKIVRR
jgi:hypothetical protein